MYFKIQFLGNSSHSFLQFPTLYPFYSLGFHFIIFLFLYFLSLLPFLVSVIGFSFAYLGTLGTTGVLILALFLSFFMNFFFVISSTKVSIITTVCNMPIVGRIMATRRHKGLILEIYVTFFLEKKTLQM